MKRSCVQTCNAQSTLNLRSNSAELQVEQAPAAGLSGTAPGPGAVEDPVGLDQEGAHLGQGHGVVLDRLQAGLDRRAQPVEARQVLSCRSESRPGPRREQSSTIAARRRSSWRSVGGSGMDQGLPRRSPGCQP